MAIEAWWLWMALAAIFIVGEIFTAGFFILWFGIGALVAGILALLGLGAVWQWGGFVVVSGVLFAVSRKFADRFTKKQPPGVGADRFVGKVGTVLEEIDNMKNTGRVRLDREEWRAESETGDILPEGAQVKVIRLDGVHLIVTFAKEGE
ncbi:MAG: NfeD family protein [Gemmatimonadota bacterium]|nr:MAG: NfeD family protein [Gemmatimonadota bacterium]